MCKKEKYEKHRNVLVFFFAFAMLVVLNSQKLSLRTNRIIVFVFILLSSTASCFSGKTDIYMFADISECENISSLKYENSELYRYENPSADTYLKKLSYEEYFAARYESDELEFEIFAYLFENSEATMQYFENATGKKDDLSANFSITSGVGLTGVSGSEIIVIDAERAYKVLTPHSHLEKTKKMLGEIFSEKLDFSRS